MRRNYLYSQLYAFATVVLWSSAYVFTKLALQSFSPPALALVRCAVASLCLGCVLYAKKMPLPRPAALPRFLLAGATGFALYILVFNKGSTSLDPTTSCILISTSPIITALLALLFFGEKLGTRRWLAIGMAFCGVLVMTLWQGGDISVSAGIAWMLAAAFLISVYNILQRALSRDYAPLAITAYSFFAGTLLLLPFAGGTAAQLASAPTGNILLACFLGVFPSAIAYLLWAKAIALAPRTSGVSNYMFLTPFLALLLDYAVTGNLPATATFAGGGIIMAGLLLSIFAEKKD